MSELDACLLVSELPYDTVLCSIACVSPSLGFTAQRVDVLNASRQTLFGKDAQFDFGHIQPTAVLEG